MTSSFVEPPKGSIWRTRATPHMFLIIKWDENFYEILCEDGRVVKARNVLSAPLDHFYDPISNS